MEKQEERKSSLLDGWNAPPNLVTFSRIILVIVFLALYAKAGAWGVDNVTMRWVAAVIFIIAACTDKLDGWMARKYNQVTELGKLMDPIADKLLTCGTLIVAAIFNEFGNPVLGWVVTALFLIREIGITVMRFFVIDTGGKVIAASQAGKIQDALPVHWSGHAHAAYVELGAGRGQRHPDVDDRLLHHHVCADLSCADSLPVFRWRVSGQYVRRP